MPGYAEWVILPPHIVITNALLNRFTLQVAISTVAFVLVSGNIPHIASQAGSAAQIGALFLAIRLGTILGAQLGPHALRRAPPAEISALSEAANTALCFGLYYAVKNGAASYLYILLFLKGTAYGLLPNVRVSWLKALPDPEIGRRIMIISQVIIQSSYGLIGVLLLLGIAQKFVLGLLLADALTSLVAIPIFLSLRDTRVGQLRPTESDWASARIIAAPENRPLLLADIALAAGMGGTNIFLVRVGDGFFARFGGYGFALLVYAIAYLLGGLLVQAPNGPLLAARRRVERAAPWLLPTCLAALMTPALPTAMQAVGFFAVFVIYPVALLGMESSWFVTATKERVGRVFATRTLLISVIWALGEVAFPRLALEQELIARTAAAGFSMILLSRINGTKRVG